MQWNINIDNTMACNGIQLNTVSVDNTMKCNEIQQSANVKKHLGTQTQVIMWNTNVDNTLEYKRTDSTMEYKLYNSVECTRRCYCGMQWNSVEYKCG